MTRLSLFNSPFFLGFDHFERAVDRIAKSATDSYPPYNVEQLAENRLRITLAVAGFKQAELDVQTEDNQLVICGKKGDDDDRVYLHRGIATRQFQRSFVLAEGIEVVGASLDNGLLQIDLERPLVDPQVRRIEIHSGRKAAAATAIETDPVESEPELRKIKKRAGADAS